MVCGYGDSRGVNDVGNESKGARTRGDEHPLLVHLYTLRYNLLHDVGHCRSYVCMSVPSRRWAPARARECC